MLASIFLPVLLLFQVPSMSPGGQPAVRPTPETQQTKPAATPEPKEEPPVVTKHTVHIGSKILNYTVTTGFMPLKNATSGETEARVFYMAYTLDGVPAGEKRPLMFSFNGGPGSASVWLHMGAIGPRRVRMLDNGMMPPPPYEIEDNQQTWLEQADLVFIDPVGTGSSRAAKPELAAKFFGVRGDIESIGE